MMKTDKDFKEIEILHFIIGNRKQGYLYHRIKTFIEYYKEELDSLKFINNKDEYPPRYYMDKGALEILNVLLEEITDDENS